MRNWNCSLQDMPAKEAAGRLAADLHLPLFSCKFNPLVSTQSCSRTPAVPTSCPLLHWITQIFSSNLSPLLSHCPSPQSQQVFPGNPSAKPAREASTNKGDKHASDHHSPSSSPNPTPQSQPQLYSGLSVLVSLHSLPTFPRELGRSLGNTLVSSLLWTPSPSFLAHLLS